MTDETEVLRETVTRVETLSEGIQQVSAAIVNSATAALDQLRPLKQGSQASGAAEIRHAIQVLQSLKPYMVLVQQAGPVLQDGVLAAGTEVYGRAWSDLEAALEELTSSELNQFYGLIGEIQQHLETAETSLVDATKSDARRVFSGDVSSEGVVGPDPEDLDSLKMLLALSSARRLENKTNVVVVNQIRQASTAAAGSQQVETPAALKKFRLFAQQYTDVYHSALQVLFPRDQAQTYAGLVSEVFKAEEAQLSKKVARLSKSKPKGAMSALDELDASMVYDPNGADMPEMLANAAQQLKEAYTSADNAVKSQKIENEVAIASATDRVALIVRDIVKRAPAVEATLQHVAPRSYLPASAPEWLKDFALTNKMPSLVDLFNADLVENLLFYIALQNQKLGRSPWQRGISLMFNTSFLTHFFEKNSLAAPGSLLLQRVDRYHKQGMKLYLTEWQRLSQHLMDPTQTKPGAKLSSKDREAVKERFRLFNSEFESLVERQRKASIPDKALRAEFVTAISKTIRPLYQRFYDSHRGGDFTKNLDKYLKYDMKKLDEVIATL